MSNEITRLRSNARMSQIVVEISDPKYFDEFNVACKAWVPSGNAPTRACVRAVLMKPGIDIEVAVTAFA